MVGKGGVSFKKHFNWKFLVFVGVLASLLFLSWNYNQNQTTPMTGEATFTPSCTDTDNGENYFVGGKVTQSFTSEKDFCSSNKELTEYYCEGSVIKERKVSCSCKTATFVGGGHILNSGYCDNECVDTDSNYLFNGEYFVQGKAIKKATTFSASQLKTDKCGGLFQPANQLTEYRCNLFGNVASDKTICEYGCANGKCSQEKVFSQTPNNFEVINSSNSQIDFVCGAYTEVLNGNPNSLDKIKFNTNFSGSMQQFSSQSWILGNPLPLFWKEFTFSLDFNSLNLADGMYEWQCEGVDTLNTILSSDDLHYYGKKRMIKVDMGNVIQPGENHPPQQVDYEVSWLVNTEAEIDLNDFFSDADEDDLVYSWNQVINGITITNSTNNDLVLIPLADFVGQRNFSLRVSDGEDVLLANLSLLVVSSSGDSPPQITNYLPHSATVNVAESEKVNFSVSASDADGDPLTYQWFRLNTAISGATSPNLSLSFVSDTNISVEVSDGTDEVSVVWKIKIDAGEDSTDLCGNNVIDSTEKCDGVALSSESCITQGFDSGTLACASDCNSFDLSECILTPIDSEGEITPEDQGGTSGETTQSGSVLIWVIVIILIVLIGIGGFLVWRIQGKKKTPTPPKTPPTSPTPYSGLPPPRKF